MIHLDFSISEFNISGEAIPEEVADKILKHHIQPMQTVRTKLGLACFPSLKSGYRSIRWERKQGSSGASQHTFKGKGAVDWSCTKFHENKDEFLRLIIDNTDYTRIAVYNTFIHCDYKANDGKRYLFDSTPSSKWTFKKYV